MEVREEMALAEGRAGMVLGSYLPWVPSCSSIFGTNVRTTVLCTRLWRKERRQEAYRVPAAPSPF